MELLVALREEGERDVMTDRILDAAYDLMLAFGARRLTVEDVARRVGIARVTVYRRFATKDELINAVVLREGRRLFAEVDAAVEALPSTGEQLIEGFVTILLTVRGHPLVQRTLQTEPEVVGSLIVTQAGPVIAFARAYLAGHLRRAQQAGELGAIDTEVAAELMVRLGLSLIVTPESCINLGDEREARAFATDYLLPVLRSSLPQRRHR